MAEAKRQSLNNRVATPKLNNQGPADLDTVLAKAIGARVKVTTAAPSGTLEGVLFTACPITNLVAINVAPTSTDSTAVGATPANYHIIPVSRIQTMNVLSLPGPSSRSTTPTFPTLPVIDARTIKAREEIAMKQMRDRDAMRGKGVGKEGQDIFDAISRTLPTRWDGTTMIVNDAVSIAKPYRSEDCTVGSDNQNALIRVKKVLEAERKKLTTRNGKNGVATPLERKGG